MPPNSLLRRGRRHGRTPGGPSNAPISTAQGARATRTAGAGVAGRTHSPDMADRAQIRSRIRKQRRALPPKQQQEHAWLTSRRIASTPWFARSRLGMGGGYYDRTFAFLTRRSRWQKPRLLGAAYEFQRVERLEHEPWDVPLAGVATDTRLYFPPQRTA